MRSIALLCAVFNIVGCTEPTSIVIEPLRIITFSPGSGAFCVETSVNIVAVFSHDLQADTLTADSFLLQDADGPVATTLEYDSDTFAARLTPDTPLKFDTMYTTIARAGVAGADAGALAVDIEASFTTIPRQGCTPGVECVLPSDCPGIQICANIGVCVDECVTDRDCFGGSCDAGSCVYAGVDGGPPGGDTATGDTITGDSATGDNTQGDTVDIGDAFAGDTVTVGD